MSHTPGRLFADGVKVLQCGGDNDCSVVAVCRQNAPRNTIEAMANAMLFAAASDMLEACKAHVAKGHNDTCQLLLTGDDCNCGRDLAIVAIEKAEGRKS